MSNMPKAADVPHKDHPHGHKVDIDAAENGARQAIELFRDGTYALLGLSDVQLSDGTELFIVHRKKMK